MSEGALLWEPSADAVERARLTDYMRSLDRGFETYDELWHWSVDDLDGFWASLWDYFDVKASRPYERVLGGARCPARSGSRAPS